MLDTDLDDLLRQLDFDENLSKPLHNSNQEYLGNIKQTVKRNSYKNVQKVAFGNLLTKLSNSG